MILRMMLEFFLILRMVVDFDGLDFDSLNVN